MQRAPESTAEASPRSEPRYEELGQHGKWETGAFRNFPLAGIGSLFLAAVAILGCVAVLVFSDGRAVETWPSASQPISPSVLLAIFSATANFSLRFALSEGLNNTWWRSAVRGTTLGKLQRYWDHGNGLVPSILAGRHLNWISVASIAVSLVVVDGPLLQRASSTRLATIHTNSTLVNATVATHLAYGQTGYRVYTSGGFINLGRQSFLTPSFHRVLEDYNARRPIDAGTLTGCEGICSGNIEAAGLYRDCTESQTQRTWFTSNRTTDITTAYPGTIFSIDLDWMAIDAIQDSSINLFPLVEGIPPDEPFLQLNMTYATASFNRPENFTSTEDYENMSNMTSKSCKLYSATRRYPVTIYNDTQSSATNTWNTITLSGDSESLPDTIQNQRKDIIKAAKSLGFYLPTDSDWFFYPQIGQFENRTDPVSAPTYGTLSGISTAVQSLVNSNMTFKGMKPQGGILNEFDVSGALAMQLLDSSKVGIDGFPNLRFNDPSETIFGILDELMFRSAIAAAHINTFALLNGASIHNMSDGFGRLLDPAEYYPQPQLVPMTKRQTVLVYDSKYLFLGISAGIMVLGVLLVAPTFYGFWTLGHMVSLNPIVTALSFRAPVLENIPSGISPKGLLERVDGCEVQYGEGLDSGNGEKLLKITNADMVQGPVNGKAYH